MTMRQRYIEDAGRAGLRSRGCLAPRPLVRLDADEPIAANAVAAANRGWARAYRATGRTVEALQAGATDGCAAALCRRPRAGRRLTRAIHADETATANEPTTSAGRGWWVRALTLRACSRLDAEHPIAADATAAARRGRARAYPAAGRTVEALQAAAADGGAAALCRRPGAGRGDSGTVHADETAAANPGSAGLLSERTTAQNDGLRSQQHSRERDDAAGFWSPERYEPECQHCVSPPLEFRASTRW